MKKLYISVPVEHRKKEDVVKSIEKLHVMAEIIFDQKLEVIQLPLEVPASGKERKAYIAGNLSKMVEADYFISVNHVNSRIWETVWAERDLARDFNIPSTFVDGKLLMPDLDKLQNGVIRRRGEEYEY